MYFSFVFHSFHNNSKLLSKSQNAVIYYIIIRELCQKYSNYWIKILHH